MSKRKFVIGITGGIGSGKTVVSDFFARKGITIVDADVVARQVVELGQPSLRSISERYGAQILQKDGSLDRRQLRDIIFKDDGERVWLETLLHPVIRRRIMDELNKAASSYTALVSPLMIETNQQALVDRLLVIDLPVNIQIARTSQRDSMTKEQTLAIINAQSSREDKLTAADDVVDNSQSLDYLYQQLEVLHAYYLTVA